jgi:CheY-like chemotaxis protein
MSSCSCLVQAEDGAEGVRCVEESIEAKKPFDVIFMDNVMPNLTGPKATRLIRTTCGYKGMVVALTGSVLDDDVRDFMSSGATSVIAKPMQQAELERILSGDAFSELSSDCRLTSPSSCLCRLGDILHPMSKKPPSLSRRPRYESLG